MKVSIITPFHIWHPMKLKQLKRCVSSVSTQSHLFEDFEHILVDDGSTVDIDSSQFPDYVKYSKIDHKERLFAYKKGLEEATGDWILFLDSDDELFGHSLFCMSQMIAKHPGFKIFNYESVHVRRNYITTTRGAFKPKSLEVGHEDFGGGNIVNSTFIFHKSLVDDKMLKGLEFSNPWDFSTTFQEEFPKQKEHFVVDHPDHPNGCAKELGNPWGNDHYFFYRLTRRNHCKSFDIPLVLIHHEGKSDGEYHELN